MLTRMQKLWVSIKRKSPIYHAGYCAGQRVRAKLVEDIYKAVNAPPGTVVKVQGFEITWGNAPVKDCNQCVYFLAWRGET